MPYLIILSGLLALFLFWLAARQKRSTGLPGGRIIYSDTRRWGPVEKPLYDHALGLAGKPDYLIKQGRVIIPVEVKTGRTPAKPHETHIFQLAAYCLLVERSLGTRPPYGVLHYPKRTFAIDYTPTLEAALLDVMAEMRLQAQHSQVQRSHSLPYRCEHCGFNAVCDQRLSK